jgi:sterol desaturase/sphingolipid hydroxylase (fatty acid hydroxylase superfamily)
VIEFLLAHEGAVRTGLLIGGFGVIAAWEGLSPRRALSSKLGGRWLTNIGLTLLISIFAGLLFPFIAVGVAVAAKAGGIGLLNWIAVPAWVAVPASLVLLDLSRYVQHITLHRLPVLWRLHRVHHSDLDCDCTTGLRFHPLEWLLTSSVHLLFVLLLGAPPLAVFIYETAVIVLALTSHANISLPLAADRVLRRMIVTPDMHLVHHSTIREESDCNFGVVLSTWDRLFHTYRAQPQAGHDNMAVGLVEWRDERCANLLWLLALPFIRRT